MDIESGNTNMPQGQRLVINMHPAKKWRCANGHEWAGEPWRISFDRDGDPPFHRDFQCCIECLADAFARIAVPVEEVWESPVWPCDNSHFVVWNAVDQVCSRCGRAKP